MKCVIEGCDREAKAKGWCGKHYQQFYKNAPDYRKAEETYKRKHPFYHLWFERKQAGLLCDEWLEFITFVKGIEPKPEGNFFLVRTKEGPFGPDNFKWIEKLQKREDETWKEWWARKRAARLAANPSMDRERNFKRYYGMTVDKYEEMLEKQNFVCEICKEKETSIDYKTGALRKLSVDHCHTTNKIRDLLCWRCNSVIGRVNEDIDLLSKMIAYLKKHEI